MDKSIFYNCVYRRILLSIFLLTSFHILNAQPQTLKKLLTTPYIGQYVAAKNSDQIAFTVNESGLRNIYYAAGPLYKPYKLTNYESDDAQEITSLSISNDGKWIVFVRGADHGGNSAAVPTNSASLVGGTSLDIYTYSVSLNKLFHIGTGDYPIIHPNQKDITYLKSGQVWNAPLDKSQAPKQLFHTKGNVNGLQWQNKGEQLAFSVRRGDHSFIGVFSKHEERIKWIAPSFYHDVSPRWSPDGKELAFIRRDADGGILDSLTSFGYQEWSIQLADVVTGNCKTIYKSPSFNAATYPRIAGQTNLEWNHPKYITFMSYEDGWPHIYRLDKSTNTVKQLTKGSFAVDQIKYNLAGNEIIFSANHGKDTYDFDRSHIGKVNIEHGSFVMITSGEGIEMAPFYFNNDKNIGYKSSTYDRPVLPSIKGIGESNNQLIGKELFVNDNYDFVKPEQVFVTAEDGVRSSGQLFKPKKGKENGSALVYIHGGPRRQMYLGWHHSDYYFNDYIVNQYLASQGFTVLAINYRLGTGYGFDFQHAANSGSFGASEYLDVLAAGKWLKSQNGIDASKVGLFGGSYGGYLTALGLAKDSDLFKAGVDIHGVHNRQRKQNPEYYAPDFELATRLNWESSPSKFVDSWKSPVLVIHGDDDQNVAFSQSIDIYKRLKRQGVDVEVLVLPDENHHWQLFENLVKVKEATVEFLKRKLL